MFEKRRLATRLRKRGLSIRDIEEKLNIPRSTLSGWLKNVELTSRQKEILFQKWKKALIKARKKAVLWHNKQKELRLAKAAQEAENLLSNIDLRNGNIIELALAMLYLGEGHKRSDDTAMGNSDPLILKTFVSILVNFYRISPVKIKCGLHLRADQDPEKIKKFWSRTLGVPLRNFVYANIDKRTAGSKTFPNYKGVCVVRCGNVAIQRKLLNISRGFCEKIKEGRLAQW